MEKATYPRFPWAIRETVAVDEEYDTRYTVTRNGGGSFRQGPAAWVAEFADREWQARNAFSRANHGGYASSLFDLLPFFAPPLERDLAKRLLQAEQRRRR